MLTIRNHYSLFNFFSLKERDHAESSAICAPKKFSSTSRSNQFGRYTSKTLNKLCNKKYCDIRNAPSLNFEMFIVAMMKSEILNQLCCLKEIIVLPSTMMFQAHPNKVHNTYAPCYHCPHMDVDYKGRNEEAEMIYYGNCCIYTPYAFYRLVSDQQKPRTAFLHGREANKSIWRRVQHLVLKTTRKAQKGKWPSLLQPALAGEEVQRENSWPNKSGARMFLFPA